MGSSTCFTLSPSLLCSLIFIEKSQHQIIYRSRDCFQLLDSYSPSDKCVSCVNLIEKIRTGKTLDDDSQDEPKLEPNTIKTEQEAFCDKIEPELEAFNDERNDDCDVDDDGHHSDLDPKPIKIAKIISIK